MTRSQSNSNNNKRKLRIKNPQYDYYNDEEKAYYKALDVGKQQDIALMENNIIFANNRLIPLRFQVLESGVDETQAWRKTVDHAAAITAAAVEDHIGTFGLYNAHIC